MPNLFSKIKKELYALRFTLHPNSGFTLIEAVLIIAIVGLMALLITNLPSSINLNSNSNYQSLAKQIASKQLEDLRLQTYQNLANGTQGVTDTRLNSLPRGSGDITISDCPAQICTNGEQLKSVTVTINWFEKSSTISATFTTMIGEGGLK